MSVGILAFYDNRNRNTFSNISSLYNQQQNFIFGRDDGTAFPKSTLYNTFSKALEHIEHEHLPIHSTRHIHAVMMLEARASMKELQDRLGHASM